MFTKKTLILMQFGPYSFEIKNRDKLFYPGQNITKGDLIDYYDKIADHLLPYLEGAAVF